MPTFGICDGGLDLKFRGMMNRNRSSSSFAGGIGNGCARSTIASASASNEGMPLFFCLRDPIRALYVVFSALAADADVAASVMLSILALVGGLLADAGSVLVARMPAGARVQRFGWSPPQRLG